MITIIIYIPIYILIKEKAHYAMYNVQDYGGFCLVMMYIRFGKHWHKF